MDVQLCIERSSMAHSATNLASETKKSAVITGASSGIGQASVLRMLKAGWQVFATVRKLEDGQRLQAENGPDVIPIILDVQDHSTIASAAEQVTSQLNG